MPQPSAELLRGTTASFVAPSARRESVAANAAGSETAGAAVKEGDAETAATVGAETALDTGRIAGAPADDASMPGKLPGRSTALTPSAAASADIASPAEGNLRSGWRSTQCKNHSSNAG